ncbi:MAG TPA: hydantoinase/oxoprolinase family protein [Steroidobacteraceae bacterium]|nr:hydantoinase/oxoprolinase family protein [Steroidobacteraceae bacterium]
MGSNSIVRVATDVGGTFTDLVYFRTDLTTGSQAVITAKADTTPPNFERGVLDVMNKAGVDVAAVDFIAHGTTVVINALTERKGAKVALITTSGFRDSIEIARGNRPDFFNLAYRKPVPFVPRYLRREVPGRMTYLAQEREPLDLSGLPAIIEEFRRHGVEAVAVCLLHSYANPDHELRTVAEVRKLWPDIPVVASHQITREWREYERTNTAVLSAYVQPIAERYLRALERGLKSRGFDGQLYVMQSNCGIDTIDRSSAVPITMVESGPASGFWGAAELGRLIGVPNLLALDIGGTTAKCSLIERGQVKILTDYWIERSPLSAGYPIMVPVVDLVEIGNGGGSIAWIDDFKKLHVGPRSAGASPGPAAYGRGGANATTTDANLALGRINPHFFCGGSIEADTDAVDRALDAVAGPLNMTRIEAARGIVRIANSNMVNALKLVSMNRGHDPRDFALVAFGGGGPMHAVALATELSMSHVIVPRGADVFSAWGMLMSELRRDYFATRLVPFNAAQAKIVNQLCADVMGMVLEQFGAEDIAVDKVRFERFGKFRYENQEHHVEIRLPDGDLDAAGIETVSAAFHAAYEREYTYRLDAPVEFVGLHLVARADIGKLEPVKLQASGRKVAQALKGRREVDYALEGVHTADIYDGDLLEPGMELDGPAVIETRGTTVLAHPGNRVRMDDYGNIHIHLARSGH